eukprot:1193230-Prorocentrum_minimum.AAC.5
MATTDIGVRKRRREPDPAAACDRSASQGVAEAACQAATLSRTIPFPTSTLQASTVTLQGICPVTASQQAPSLSYLFSAQAQCGGKGHHTFRDPDSHCNRSSTSHLGSSPVDQELLQEGLHKAEAEVRFAMLLVELDLIQVKEATAAGHLALPARQAFDLAAV